jgi:hypothetical protein
MKYGIYRKVFSQTRFELLPAPAVTAKRHGLPGVVAGVDRPVRGEPRRFLAGEAVPLGHFIDRVSARRENDGFAGANPEVCSYLRPIGQV